MRLDHLLSRVELTEEVSGYEVDTSKDVKQYDELLEHFTVQFSESYLWAVLWQLKITESKTIEIREVIREIDPEKERVLKKLHEIILQQNAETITTMIKLQRA